MPVAARNAARRSRLAQLLALPAPRFFGAPRVLRLRQKKFPPFGLLTGRRHGPRLIGGRVGAGPLLGRQDFFTAQVIT